MRRNPLAQSQGSCVLEGYRRIDRELVNERAVPGCLPDRSFQRGLGVVRALSFLATDLIRGAQLLASEHLQLILRGGVIF
jgi:hypothetical protein